jgi:parallel beta-helix repeat protein
MLAVTATPFGTILDIDITASDTAYVRLNATGDQIEVASDSSFKTDFQSFPASSVSTITVEGETNQSEGLVLTSGQLFVTLNASEIERITFAPGAGVAGRVDVTNASSGLVVDGLGADDALLSSSAAGITLSGVVTISGCFELLASGSITATAADVTAASVVVAVNGTSGNVFLDNPANTIDAFAASSQNVPGGLVSIATNGGLQLGVSLSAGEDGVYTAGDGAIVVLAASDVTQLAGSSLTAGSLTATVATGDIVLTEQENNVGAFAASSAAAGGAIRLAVTGDLVIGVGTLGIESTDATIELEAFGSISQVAEIVGDSLVIAQMLDDTSDESINLPNTSNAINTLTASNKSSGGNVTFVNGQPLTLHDPASDEDPSVPDIAVETNEGDISVTADGPITVLGELSYGEGGLTLTDTSVTPGSVTYRVTNGEDAGPSSLRRRLQNVHDNQAASQLQTIFFRVDVESVSLLTPLADITRQVTIDGEGRPVEIDGSDVAGSPSNGFVFAAGSQGSLVNSLSIGGFDDAGVRIETSSITITGCFIGISAAGASRSNGVGVLVTGADAQGAAIGQATLGNVIAASTSHGISFESGASGAVVGNTIGLDLGGSQLANGGAGVSITDAGGVVVGGATADDRNVISGNAGDGVAVSGVSGATVLEGNWIGVSTDGLSGIGNAGVGVRVTGGGASVRIGSESGGGNVISGNGAGGILIEESSATEILGNIIGLDADGAADVGNQGDGVAVTEFAASTVIGRVGGANVISGNTGIGVYVSPTATDTSIMGNTIGLDLGGAMTFGNGVDGVFVEGATRTLVASNVVSGNGGDGIRVQGQAATSTTITGNLVGLTASGDEAAGNAAVGIRISDVPGIVVGGGSAAERNVVSGNGSHGILITSDLTDGAADASVASNYVGTNLSGATAIANAGDGVRVEGTGASAAIVVGNLVSGNDGVGIRVTGGASGSRIAGNVVGLDASSSVALGNVGDGVRIEGGAGHFVGGEAADRNIVSGNGASGIVVAETASTLIASNIAGTNDTGARDLGNGGDGIAVVGATETIVSGNMASGNSGSGVSVSNSDSGAVADATTIVGNVLGADVTGLTALPNQQHGVVIRQASGTTLGGSFAGDRNLISGNVGNGILVDGAAATEITGNYVGVTANGYSALGNGAGGMLVSGASDTVIAGGNVVAFNGSGATGHGIAISASQGTIVGDQDLGTGNGNVIYRNRGDGVRIENGSTGTVVVGNSIGSTVTGGVGLGNEGAGVGIVGANGSTIGGLRSSASNLGNLIVGNGGGGVAIADALPDTGAGEEGNVVQGNTIRRNVGAGIWIVRSAGQVIGGTAAVGNEIGLNAGDGVQIDNTEGGTGGHIVAGNAIGTDASGSQKTGNAGDGISIVGSLGNRVGGIDGEGNLVANNRSGIVITSAEAASIDEGNTVAGNTVTANVGDGVRLEASTLNTIGAIGELPGNSVVFNGGAGVSLAGGSSGNRVAGNLIGTDGGNAVKSNAKQGVLITASEQNEVLGNTIAWNRLGGVRVVGGRENVIGGIDADGNAIRSNGGAGVVLAGGTVGNYVGGNMVRGNAAGGIAVSASRDNRIEGGNVVVKNQKFGISVSGGAGNSIDANFVGTNASQTAQLGNLGPGIMVNGGVGTSVGVTSRNVVRFNGGDGIQFTNVSAATADDASAVSSNVISSNAGAGISVTGGALVAITDNIVGGSSAGAGNGRSGIVVGGNAADVGVTGNTVLGNAVHGVELVSAIGTMVGGVAAAANTIEGNRSDGIYVAGGSRGVVIGGNTISANRGDGIEINASIGNRIEGATITSNGAAGVTVVSAKASSTADGNVISGATIDSNAVGVSILGSSGTSVIDGNTISRSAAAGILVGAKSSQTVIESNTITESRGAGVEVNASRSTAVRDNQVTSGGAAGVLLTQASGTSAIDGNTIEGNEIEGNATSGITLVGSSFNALTGNTVHGNRGHGIALRQASNANSLLANAVGYDATGAVNGNGGDGIRISGSFSNVIGQGNDVSSNAGAGVSVLDSFAATSATGNRIEATTVTDNGGAGVVLNGGAHVVGGTAGLGNTITGNAGHGVAISAPSGVPKIAGATVAGNTIQSNGGSGISLTGVAGTAISGNSIGDHAAAGIALVGGTGNRIVSNVIGGDFGANVAGVSLSAGAAQNVVAGNTISANEGDGIAITGARSTDNLIGARSVGTGEASVANRVFANLGAGIRVAQGIRNQVAGNSIYTNVGGGIVLQDGGNSSQPSPTLTSARRVVVAGRPQLQVTGEVRGAPRQRIVIDLYRNDVADGNPATGLDYQARATIGRVTVTLDATGRGTFTTTLSANVPSGDRITAVATTASGVVGNASQQSAVAISA